jgi:hypothetical protein
MWYAATLNAFDCLERVHVSVVIRAHPDGGADVTAVVWQGSVTVEGVGEADPQRWLADALVALVETL